MSARFKQGLGKAWGRVQAWVQARSESWLGLGRVQSRVW